MGATSVTVQSEDASSEVVPMRKGPWMPEEDKLLLSLVDMHGPHEWAYLAEHIPGRVGKQCRERYYTHLAPDVRKEAWTAQEDAVIIHVHHSLGNKWTRIAKALGNGRSPNSVKNRWHSSIKNRINDYGGEVAVKRSAKADGGSCKCGCTTCSCGCRLSCCFTGRSKGTQIQSRIMGYIQPSCIPPTV